jgi:hypothetical protein
MRKKTRKKEERMEEERNREKEGCGNTMIGSL